MKNTLALLILILLLFPSCNQTHQQHLDSCQAELAQKSQELEKALSKFNEVQLKTPLVHIVFLRVKENISLEALSDLFKGIKTLENISGVTHLQTGGFTNLGDERALSQYAVVLQMEFATEADYQHYQQDSIHLSFKEKAGPYLSGPPATYDFIKQ